MIPGGAPEITLQEDMGFVFAMQTDNPEEPTEMSLELPAAGVDKEMRLRTYIVNHKSAEDKETYGGEGVAVALWQEANGEEHLLGQQYVYFESEINLI